MTGLWRIFFYKTQGGIKEIYKDGYATQADTSSDVSFLTANAYWYDETDTLQNGVYQIGTEQY